MKRLAIVIFCLAVLSCAGASEQVVVRGVVYHKATGTPEIKRAEGNLREPEQPIEGVEITLENSSHAIVTTMTNERGEFEVAIDQLHGTEHDFFIVSHESYSSFEFAGVGISESTPSLTPGEHLLEIGLVPTFCPPSGDDGEEELVENET